MPFGYDSAVGSLTSRQQARRKRASPERATSRRTANDAPREGRTIHPEARKREAEPEGNDAGDRSKARSSAWDSHKPRPCESDLQRATVKRTMRATPAADNLERTK